MKAKRVKGGMSAPAAGRGGELAWRFVGELTTQDVTALREALEVLRDLATTSEGTAARYGLDVSLYQAKQARCNDLLERLKFTDSEVRG